MKRTVLIDGDQFAYKAGFAAEEPLRWDDDTWSLHASEGTMTYIIDTLITKAVEEVALALQVDVEELDYIVYLSGHGCFRKRIDINYKANRNDVRKPVGLRFCRDHMITNHKAVVTGNDLEADDVVACIAVANPDDIIYGQDKDYLTVPCWLYQGDELLKVTHKMANHNLRMQTLTGDSADNYKGAKGIGVVKAAQWLEQHGDNWNSVLSLFEKVGMTRSDCTRNARLARILRKPREQMKWRPKYAKKQTQENSINEQETVSDF